MDENNNQPTKSRMFWRIQKECLRRAVTPFVMYFMMSLLLLVCQALKEKSLVLTYILSAVCLLGMLAYNAHLCYNSGKMHFDSFLTGNLHRENALFGIESGGDHHVEKEYRVYKGFIIGFYIGLPVILFGLISGLCGEGGMAVKLIYAMICSWASIPISWIVGTLTSSAYFFSMLMAIVPIVVSGVFYIVGAKREETRKRLEKERLDRVAEIGNRNQGKK